MDSPTETGLEISNDSYESPQNPNSFEGISSSGLDQSASSSPVTPKSDRIHEFDNRSSDVSPNHDSSNSSYSELDSEAEAFYSTFNHNLVSPRTSDELGEKQMSYGELMKKFLLCEEELRTTSLKLLDSEQEIERLKCESDGVLLEAARREIETRDSDIAAEKRRVFDLETKLSDSVVEIENLVNELKVHRECLDVSNVEISELKETLCDCYQEKTKLQRDIDGLLEKKTFFETRVKEIESFVEVLEDQIKHSDAEKMEMERKEIQLQDEINALKTNLVSRDKYIESLNKDFDNYKLRYDMLMAEKDGVCAEVDNLKAEMRSKDIQIEQKEEHLKELRYKQTEFVTESRSAKNTAEELKAMVKDLEKQGESQRIVISKGEEEKREAIRQLCFTLDHYKSGYRQLIRILQSTKN